MNGLDRFYTPFFKLIDKCPRSWLLAATGGAIFLYSAILGHFLYHNPIMPDEWWLYLTGWNVKLDAEARGWFTVFKTQANTFGYGSTYWFFYGLLCEWFTDGLKAFRLLVWGLYTLIPLMWFWQALNTPGANKKTADEPLLAAPYTLAAIWVWITMPIALWISGRPTGPEALSSFFLFLAGFVMLNTSFKKPLSTALIWVLIGFSIGIRNNDFPFIILPVIWTLWQIKDLDLKQKAITLAQQGGIAALFGLLGVVLANPILVTNNSLFFHELLKTTKGTSFSLDLLRIFFTDSTFAWDRAYLGGFFELGLGIFASAAFITFWVQERGWKKGVLEIVAILAFSILYFAIGGKVYGRYLFSVTAMIPLLILIAKHKTKSKTLLLCAIVAFNLGNIPRITVLKEQLWAHRLIEQKETFQTQIKNDLASKPIALLIDFSEPGLFSSYGYIPDFSFLGLSNQQIPILSDAGASDWITGKNFTQFDDKIPNVLILVGKRINQSTSFADFETHLKTKLIPRLHPKSLETYHWGDIQGYYLTLH